MKNIYKGIKTFPLLKVFASLKITVTCLSLLFILTFWGTIDQVENGLYHAQERFFHSFFFLVLGFIPFPGAQMVLWVLFINLVCVALTRFVYKLSHIGILMIHLGLLTYFIAAFVTLHCVEESHLTMKEGASSNLSSAYHDWELSVWKKEKNVKKVVAYDSKDFPPEQMLDFGEFGFSFVVQKYLTNAMPDLASGIAQLNSIEPNKDPQKNLPGGEFILKVPNEKDRAILLFGGKESPLEFKVQNQTYQGMLRLKKYHLPITVKLIDFMKEVHPNTDIARSYKSKVEIDAHGLNREVIISMNNPLRYKEYTFYQASYSIDAMGRELSTLAVVKNQGRLLPYIASLGIFAGLVVHFLLMAFKSRPKTPQIA